jgi:hypothetical protein
MVSKKASAPKTTATLVRAGAEWVVEHQTTYGDEVPFLGFDNWTFLCSYAPALTAVM